MDFLGRPLDQGGGFGPHKKARTAYPWDVCLGPMAFCSLCPFYLGMVGPLPVGPELGAKFAPLAPYRPAELPHLVFKGLVSPTPTASIHMWWGVLFVDATHHADRFKIGVWGLVLGGRLFHCCPFVKTQQEAKLGALMRGLRMCINVGWRVWRLVGGNESALSKMAGMRVGARLKRQDGHPVHLSTSSND